MVETIDSHKLATKLNKELDKAKVESPLKVLIQVQTGGELTKFGVDP
jgi:uncharacterized pyridoxal phosphate-containing UPF0001 family protein